MIKNSSKILALATCVSVFALGLAIHNNLIKLPIEKMMHSQYIADFGNDKILMGASHNVFVGKVIQQVGTKNRGSGPETQFAVEVISNIKGNLTGTVVVDQFGGYENGVLYLMDGDIVQENSSGTSVRGDRLLEPGKTYLFASRYSAAENWYTLISHPNTRKLLSSDKKLGSMELKTLAEKDTRFLQLQEAYKNEIPFDVDVKTNNTRNSFESTQKIK